MPTLQMKPLTDPEATEDGKSALACVHEHVNNLDISSGSHLLLLAQTQAERRPAEAHGHDRGGKGRWPEAPRESAEGCRRNRVTRPLHECVQHNLQGAEQNDTGDVLWSKNRFSSPLQR